MVLACGQWPGTDDGEMGNESLMSAPDRSSLHRVTENKTYQYQPAVFVDQDKRAFHILNELYYNFFGTPSSLSRSAEATMQVAVLLYGST